MNKLFDPATDFKFTPAEYVPFKDRELCEKLRKISGTDLEKHSNPNFKIKVMMNPHPVLIATLFSRIKEASEKGKKITLILGNPEPDTAPEHSSKRFSSFSSMYLLSLGVYTQLLYSKR